MPRANRIAADFLREQMHTDGIKSSELSSVFTEEPPDLDTFLYDSSYLNHLRPTLPTVDSDGYAFELSPIQRDFLRSFEQIFFPELYIAMVEEFGPSPGEKVASTQTSQFITLKTDSGLNLGTSNQVQLPRLMRTMEKCSRRRPQIPSLKDSGLCMK